MRLKVVFDQKLRLGDYTKVVVPVPKSIEQVSELIEYLRDTFGLPDEVTGPLSVSIDDFVITPDQDVVDALRNDDVIRVMMRKPVSGSTPLASGVKRQSVEGSYPVDSTVKCARNEEFTSPAESRFMNDSTVKVADMDEFVSPAESHPARVSDVKSSLTEEFASPAESNLLDEYTIVPTAASPDAPPLPSGHGFFTPFSMVSNDSPLNAAPILPDPVEMEDSPLPPVAEFLTPQSDIAPFPLKVGDTIRFIEKGQPAHTDGVVRGIQHDIRTEDNAVVFTNHLGSWDSLPLDAMTELVVTGRISVVKASPPPEPEAPPMPEIKTRASPLILPVSAPASLIKSDPDEADRRKIEQWRDRQRNKSLAALRRQIEWIVKQEGELSVDELMRKPRIRDLTERFDDVGEAVAKSGSVRVDGQRILKQ